MARKRAIRLGLGIAVSVLFIWLIGRSINLSELGAALAAADSRWIAAGVGLFCLGYVCRIQRWRLMLAMDAPEITWRRAAVPFLISIAANNVLPFRAGDVMRVFAFSRWLGVDNIRVLATMVVERLLDLLSLLLALGLALFVLGPEIGARASGLLGLGATGILLTAGVVASTLIFPALFRQMTLALLKALPHGWQVKLHERLLKFFDVLIHHARGTRMLALLAWSIMAWVLEGSVFYAAARAIPAIVDPVAGWIALPIATLATLLPSTPGYAGTFHYFAAQAAEMLGNTAIAAIAFAVLVHLILWLTATLAGGVCALFWAFSFKELPRREDIAPVAGDTPQP